MMPWSKIPMGRQTKGRALWTTDAVQTWIAESPSSKVLGVYRRSCNLINQHDRLMTVAHESIGKGPFTLVIDIENTFGEHAVDIASLIKLNSPIIISQSYLEIGNLTIDIINSKLWNPEPKWKEVDSQGLRLLLDSIGIHFAAVKDQDGFIAVLDSGCKNPEIRQAKEGWSLLRQGLTEDDEGMWRRGSRILAGLGHGLTPAGDDFLMGIMHALWLLCPIEKAEAWSAQSWAEAGPRTTKLSAAWLEAAQAGQAGEIWHELIKGAARLDTQAINAAIKSIMEIGHSSGTDALTGFYLLASALREFGVPE